MRLSTYSPLDSDLRQFALAAVAVVSFMAVFIWRQKVYDISTGALFALMIGLLARRQWWVYYVVFAVACVNRETTILMTLVFVVYLHRERLNWVPGAIYQVAAYMLIRMVVMWVYADNPGVPFLFRPVANIQFFLAVPRLSAIHWAGFVVVTWLCLRNWTAKPWILRCAFAVLSPSLLLFYLMFGWAFEIRVFAELYPVAFALAVYPVELRGW